MQDETAKRFGLALPAEDQASTLTSGAGLVAALVGGVILVALAAGGDGWQLVGASVFATTLLLLYLSSTLYHAATDPGARARLKVFDHCSIYLLIAGTYTPFTLIALRGHEDRHRPRCASCPGPDQSAGCLQGAGRSGP